MNPDGGNVQAGVNFFNSTVSSDASAPTSGEAMGEGLFDTNVKKYAKDFVDNLTSRLYKDKKFDVNIPLKVAKNNNFWNMVNDLCD